MIGLLLAAGSGRRYGGPKALADTGDGPWVQRALDALDGCDSTIVVVGAGAAEVTAVIGARSTVVVNPAFAEGMASSLLVGLASIPADAEAVVVMLVDLPDVTAAVTQRVMAAAGHRPGAALLRAAYDGRPGHPVLIGREHLDGLSRALTFGGHDEGGSSHLRAQGVRLVECGDLATGADVDRPPPRP